MGEDEMQINAILENLQRADISPFEEAMAYRRALDELGLDVASLARRLGISQHWRITDRLRLLGLTEDNRALVAKGVISMTQAYHMAALSPNGQQAFVKIAMQGHATTYEAARAAAEMIASKEAQVEMFAPAPKRQSIRSLEDRIEQIGGALQPMFKDGPFRIQGAIDPGAGERCLEKIRLLRKHLAQVENELLKAVSVSVAA
jgi:ParB family chromosome partitioning protein